MTNKHSYCVVIPCRMMHIFIFMNDALSLSILPFFSLHIYPCTRTAKYTQNPKNTLINYGGLC